MNETVHIKNLDIRSGSRTIVSRVNLKVENGEIFGLVGESGSGKTLTAKSAIGLLPENLELSAEEIITAGSNIVQMSKKERKMHIGRNTGYIPQNTVFYLHPMIKIKNQIGDGYMYHMKKGRDEALKKASELLYKVGFENPKNILNLYPWQLSGGMRQRVNISMALMNDPKLIIADEPTTALDSTVQKQVMELFRVINEEMGISILLISHDLSLIKRYSRSMAVMYAGQIVESGSTEQVFSDPRHPYTRMLIEIIPSFKIKKNEPLTEIPGYVQDYGRDGKGCVFMKRCNYAMDICAEIVNEHEEDGHYYKCNLDRGFYE